MSKKYLRFVSECAIAVANVLFLIFFTIMNMKKFPEVKMREVAAVFACQKDDERLKLLRQVVIRSLMDYYAVPVNLKMFIVAADPVTSAQMAGLRFDLVTQIVRKKFPLWWNVSLVSTEDVCKSYAYWQGRIARIKEYQRLLDEFPRYHILSRRRIKEAVAGIENEPVSLRGFLRVCFYLYKDLRQSRC